MMRYCLQDTLVTHRLWTALAPEKWSQPSIDFEHKIAEICHRVRARGWTFDSHKAGELYAQLSIEKATIEDELQELFPPWTVEEEFIPKVKTLGSGTSKVSSFRQEEGNHLQPEQPQAHPVLLAAEIRLAAGGLHCIR